MNKNQIINSYLQVSIIDLNQRLITEQQNILDKKTVTNKNLNYHRIKTKANYKFLKNLSYSAYLTVLNQQIHGNPFILKGFCLGSNRKQSKSMIHLAEKEKSSNEVAEGNKTEKTKVIQQYLVPNYVYQHQHKYQSYKRDRSLLIESKQNKYNSLQKDGQSHLQIKRHRSYSNYSFCESKKTRNGDKIKNDQSRFIANQKKAFNQRKYQSELTNLNQTKLHAYHSKDTFGEVSKNCISLRQKKLYKNSVTSKYIAPNKSDLVQSTKVKLQNIQPILSTKRHPFYTILHIPRRKTYISFSNFQKIDS